MRLKLLLIAGLALPSFAAADSHPVIKCERKVHSNKIEIAFTFDKKVNGFCEIPLFQGQPNRYYSCDKTRTRTASVTGETGALEFDRGEDWNFTRFVQLNVPMNMLTLKQPFTVDFRFSDKPSKNLKKPIAPSAAKQATCQAQVMEFPADPVAPHNKALSKRIGTDEKVGEEIGQLTYDPSAGKPIPYSELKGDAKKAYDEQVKDSGEEFACARILTVASLGGAKLIHVCESAEGNGCEGFFNSAGEYLNRYCFSESSSYGWSEK